MACDFMPVLNFPKRWHLYKAVFSGLSKRTTPSKPTGSHHASSLYQSVSGIFSLLEKNKSISVLNVLFVLKYIAR
jgi:hypothetical protein